MPGYCPGTAPMTPWRARHILSGAGWSRIEDYVENAKSEPPTGGIMEMEQNAVSNPAEDARAHGDIVPSSGISGWVRSRASAIRPDPLRKLRSFDR